MFDTEGFKLVTSVARSTVHVKSFGIATSITAKSINRSDKIVRVLGFGEVKKYHGGNMVDE